MSGRFTATVCVPLHGQDGRVELAVEIPDLGALTSEARSLVFALLGRCVEFAADMYAPRSVDTPSLSMDFAPPSSNGSAAPEVEPERFEPPTPVACPVEGCAFVARSENGLRTHLATTHKVRGASAKAVVERKELVDRAMGRGVKPEILDEYAEPRTAMYSLGPEANGNASTDSNQPTASVEWPAVPMRKVPFDPDEARRRAAGAI